MSIHAMLNEDMTARIQSGGYCVWSGEHIGGLSFMLVMTNDEVAAVSFDSVDAFADAMESFSAEAATAGEAISPSEDVWYGCQHKGGTCPVCLAAVEGGASAVIMDRPHPHKEEKAFLTRLFVHPSCTDGVASLARSVWGHTDVVLGNEV